MTVAYVQLLHHFSVIFLRVEGPCGAHTLIVLYRVTIFPMIMVIPYWLYLSNSSKIFFFFLIHLLSAALAFLADILLLSITSHLTMSSASHSQDTLGYFVFNMYSRYFFHLSVIFFRLYIVLPSV